MAPKLPITHNGARTTNPRMIILKPMAHKTWSINTLYNGFRVKANDKSIISTKMSPKPLLIKKALSSPLVRRVPAIYAEIPLRNTKLGAQKCVIHG